MNLKIWKDSVEALRNEIPARDFNAWIRPLLFKDINGIAVLYSPNKFVRDWVNNYYLDRLLKLLHEFGADSDLKVRLLVDGEKITDSPIEDCFNVLGLKSNARASAIRVAYINKIKKCSAESSGKNRAIEMAYKKLIENGY